MVLSLDLLKQGPLDTVFMIKRNLNFIIPLSYFMILHKGKVLCCMFPLFVFSIPASRNQKVPRHFVSMGWDNEGIFLPKSFGRIVRGNCPCFLRSFVNIGTIDELVIYCSESVIFVLGIVEWFRLKLKNYWGWINLYVFLFSRRGRISITCSETLIVI